MSLLISPASQTTLLEVKAKTDNLPAAPANEATLTTVDGLVDAIKAKTDNLPATPADEATATGIKTKTDNLPATPANESTSTGIKTQTDKLAGAAPVTGSAIQDWQTAEADVVSIGAAGVRNKVHDLSVNVSALVGTTITVRLYKKVKDTERKIYQQVFNAASDPPGLPIINGSWATHDIIRVTLQSNDAADNGKAVDYDYMLEAM